MSVATGAPRRVTARPSQVLKALGDGTRRADPCTIVILGAHGDLAQRKLLWSIYQLAKDNLLPPGTDVLGVARRDMDDDAFRAMMLESVRGSDEISDFDQKVWDALAPRMHYAAGDLSDAAAYRQLGERLGQIETHREPDDRNRLFYLAVPP